MLSVVEQVETILPFALSGTVTRIVGLTVAAAGFPAPLGAICRIHREQGQFARRVGRRLSRRGNAAFGLWGSRGRAARQSRVAAAVGSRCPRGRTAAGSRSRRPRAIYRSSAPGRSTASHSLARHADAATRPATDRFATRYGHPRDRCAVDMRQGATAGNLFGQRSRKKHAAWADGKDQLGRRQRHRAGRRAGTRSPRIFRTGSRARRASAARSSSSPPATSRPWSG